VRKLRYLLTFGGDPALLDADDARREQAREEVWWRELCGSGRVRGLALLQEPFMATTLRFSPGGRTIHDGPFTDEAQAVGGYGIIEAEDLDEVLQIALTWPGTGYVEIRPMRGPDRVLGGKGRLWWASEGVADS
jgi:hypothetical protein